jgi:L-rhamnose mutarotase
MHRIAVVLTMKPVTVAAYERHHRQVWADILEELLATLARTSSIVRHGIQIFVSLVVDDFARYQRCVANSTFTTKWEMSRSDSLIREFDPKTSVPPFVPEGHHLRTEEDRR